MFWFLVVEDDEPTLMQLKALLSEEFDGSTVDTAGSVIEGSQCLASTIKKGKAYEAALLDFHARGIQEIGPDGGGVRVRVRAAFNVRAFQQGRVDGGPVAGL